MKKILVVLFVASLLSSCNSGVLSFSAFELKDGKGLFSIIVESDGNLKVKDQKIGFINKEDGTIKDKDDNIVATFKPNGDLMDKDGNLLVNISSNGEFKTGDGAMVSWSEEGDLMKGEEKPGLKIEPADKNSFQVASVIVYTYFGFGK
jgi:hypothetical protein